MFDDVLKQVDSKELLVFAVWMPCLPKTDNAEAALAAESVLPDSRVVHYWDGEKSLGTLFGQSLFPSPGKTFAWDLYFVYAPGVEWRTQPPMPTDWWAYASGARALDGEKLRESVLDLLPESEAAELALND